MRFRDLGILRVWKSAKSMRKNAKLAPLQTALRQVAIFPHNADFHAPRVTTLAANSPNTKIFHVCLLAICVKIVNDRLLNFSNQLYIMNFGPFHTITLQFIGLIDLL